MSLDDGIRIDCASSDCPRRAIVFVSGMPLCVEHYVANMHELNDLGLTPGNLSREGGPDPRSTSPARITEPVKPPAYKPDSAR
jgi:hypothetical protein